MGDCEIITEKDENEPFEPYAWCAFHSRLPSECMAALERENHQLRRFKTGVENILMPERVSPQRRLTAIHGLLNTMARSAATTPVKGCQRYRAEDGPQFEEWCDTHNAHWAWDARWCQAGAADEPEVTTP